MTETMQPVAPGWYPDPQGHHEHRYWDGSRWTDEVADRGVETSEPLPPAPPAPTVAPASSRRRPWTVVVLVLAALALAFAGFVVLRGGDDGGAPEPSGGPLAGNYDVEGTNPDGSPYEGTAVVTGQGPDYRISWMVGGAASGGRGTVEGNRFVVTFTGDLTGRGTATYRLQDDGSLVGTGRSGTSNAEGTEILTPT